jgi:NADPH:quinone reductase-like Zn-dependent oxidoreductase
MLKASIILREPEWLGHVEAAALALTGLTAIWAIEGVAHLTAGETIPDLWYRWWCSRNWN